MLFIFFLFLLPYQLVLLHRTSLYVEPLRSQKTVYVKPLEHQTDFLLHNSYPMAGVPESSRLCWGDGGIEIPLLDGSTACKWI